MRRPLLTSRSGRMLAVLLASAALAVAPAAARASFALGLQDPGFEGSATTQQAANAYGVLSTVGGSYVRLDVEWSAVATAPPPSAVVAASPGNPGYDWTSLDAAVRQAAARHVHMLLLLESAPVWAQGPGHPTAREVADGAWDPNPAMFAAFAHAVAARYSGTFADPLRPGRALPRVTDYEIWNEENLPVYLAAPNLVSEYRALLNAGYGAIKSVHRSDLVALGGLAPYSVLPPQSMAPLKFDTELLCLRPRRGGYVRAGHCRSVRFDALAHHPYNLATTPTYPEARFGDILVADMPRLRTILNAATRLRTINPGVHPLWVTEWSWITNPPDAEVGDSFATAARYIDYSMYAMWRAGVSLIIWEGIRDDTPNYLAGVGLETPTGRPKPSLRAFAFPFVAQPQGGGGLIWGRAPGISRGRVRIQARRRGSWRPIGTARVNGDGVFSTSMAVVRGDTYRAVTTGGATSLPYLAAPIPPKTTHRFSPHLARGPS